MNIVILHYPTMFNKQQVPLELKPIIKKLSKFGHVHNYFFKFGYYKNQFVLDDLSFENASKNIHDTFKHLNNYYVIAINHAVPYGLFYANKYPKKCLGIVGYPYRFYCKESYERRIWKYKNNKGWKFSYDIDDYLIKVNNDRLQQLLDKPGHDEIDILYLIMDFNLQRQYYKIPTVFNVPTILYTRLDLNTESIIKHNYKRKETAQMKQIFNENDALFNSMMWNFDRVKYDAILMKKNKNNNFLKIKYLVSGWENFNNVIDEIILFVNK